MRLGAILVVRLEYQTPERVDSGGWLTESPWALARVAGLSSLERTASRYLAAGAELVSVLIEANAAKSFSEWRHSLPLRKVTFKVAADMGYAIERQLADFTRIGIEHSFIQSADLYVETDLQDMASFHRGGRQAVTGALGASGPLSFWILDCAKTAHLRIDQSLEESRASANIYQVREYVNDLQHPKDLRQFATDILGGICHATPAGQEVRPGIWLDEKVQIHGGARMVAPTYVGCGSTVQADTLITRGSTVESDCYIDCGSVVEDSSILAATRIGIWLDVCHSVAQGKQLMDLARGIAVQISDPNVLRWTGISASRGANIATTLEPAFDVFADRSNQESKLGKEQIGFVGSRQPVQNQSEIKKQAPISWRFGAKLIEE